MGASRFIGRVCSIVNKWNRKTIAALTALTMLTAPSAALAADISVFVDGIGQNDEVSPYLKSGRTLVPLRGVLETLGATVSWNQAEQTAVVSKGERSVVLTVGSRAVTVNGEKGMLDIAPELRNGRLMVPFRTVLEAFGAAVKWDSVNSAVRVLSEERKDKTLNLSLSGDVHSMDSAMAANRSQLTLLQQTGEGLVRRDEFGHLVPGMAKKWDISPDGLTCTFQLREGAKWSDGSKVTARDFEYAWKRAIDPKTGSAWAFQFYGIENAQKANEGKGAVSEVGVRAIDDVTLQVTLEKPQAYFLEMLAEPVFQPQKQSFVEAAGKGYGTAAAKTLANGPFKLADWQPERSMRLEKNEHYWDRENVSLEQVNYLVNRKPELEAILYKDGTIDRMPLDATNFDDWNGAPTFSVAPRDIVTYLEFNQQGPKLLQNAKIRRALAYAVDGQALTDIVYQDGKFGALGLVPMGLTDSEGRDFRVEGGDLMRRDINTPLVAKQLWDEGLKEVGLKNSPVLRLLNQDTVQQKKASEFMKQSWKTHLGLEVELENVPYKTKLERVHAKRDYDIVLSTWAGDFNDPMSFLEMCTTGHSYNNSNYSREEYDTLIANAKKEGTNRDSRLRLLHDAEELLIEDMPVAPLYHYRDAYLTQPYVKGWRDYGHGALYDLKYVQIEGRN